MFAKDALKYEALPLPHRPDMSDADMCAASNAFYEKMRQRHSVRDFSTRPVPRAVIETSIRTAGTAPSGANHQPWHFVAISDPAIKAQIRAQAEAEEQAFYAGAGGDEWIKALEPLGTNSDKPHLTIAPWLIVVFAQRWGLYDDGTKFKNYYVPESVNIATGFLLAALHHAGLFCLTHTPKSLRSLNDTFQRPASEKPTMIIAVGHPSKTATVPAVAKMKKSVDEILTMIEPTSSK